MTPSKSAITPRGHQVEALEGLRDVLARSPRAQAHMCCGSGKTFAQAFLARDAISDCESPNRAVITCLVPNRALVHQNARNFRAVFGTSVDMLGVCSEADLGGLVDADDGDGIETTTDPVAIARFLRESGPRLVVSTYQSAPVLRAALAEARGAEAPVLLGLFDEAHRTAGDKTGDDLFAYALSDGNFPIAKRAFFTATPRISEGRKAAAFSMSNAELFGPVAYTYPFRRGIEDGNVVDYDLWVPVITRAELAGFMTAHDMRGEDRAAVALIAMRKVMERTGQSRLLCYRHRVSASQSFARQMAGVFPDSLVAHVDGTTPGHVREQMMQALSRGNTLLTNCKAFVEGVDAPGLQGVVFVDHRKSIVDVVQAVGRLSRPDPDDPGKRGSIVAPILLDADDPDGLAKAAKQSGFQTLVEVAQALRANDDALEEDILERSRAAGRGEIPVTPLRGMEVIAPEGIDVGELARSITVMAMEPLGDDFATQVGRLERFIGDNGHLPGRRDNARLAAWVSSVRKKHMARSLDPAHAALLDDIPCWSWLGERSSPAGIADHIAAFRDRRNRMPRLRKGSDAEADLHAHLLEGQEAYLRHGPDADPMTAALAERALLFFAEEVEGKRAHLSGRFDIKGSGSTAEAWFYPRTDRHRKTIPVFRSGHTCPPRPFLVHVGRTDRERLQALGARHSVRITLVRAGIDPDPFRDARIRAWHAGTADRGEAPAAPKASFGWLLARLFDRKVSGRPAYTLANLAGKRIREPSAVTLLNGNAQPGTVGEALELIARLRRAMWTGKLRDDQLVLFDAAPGFSWIEPEDAGPDAVAACTRHVLHSLSETDLENRDMRMMDTGLQNTLRALVRIKNTDPLSCAPADRAAIEALAGSPAQAGEPADGAEETDNQTGRGPDDRMGSPLNDP